MQVKLRIIQVVNVRWFNATAWYALFLARLLKDAGHDVLVLGLEGTDSFAKAKEWGLNPIALNLNTQNPFCLCTLYKELKALVVKFSPDVVNCHRGENFFLWAILRRMYPFALVRTRGDQRRPKTNWINKLLYNKLCDLHIATNAATTFELTKFTSCPEAMVETLLGGVNTNVFRFDALGRSRVRAEYGIADNAFVLGYVGRFDPVKGVQELIMAVGAMYKNKASLASLTGHDFYFILAGYPANISLEMVHVWLEQAGISEITIVTGKRSDIASVMSAMDAGAVPSQGSEAIARAALEMMSCGLPVFSTRIGVLPDLVPDWATVPAGDHEALVKLITQIVDNRVLRQQLKEACLQVLAELSESDFLRLTLKAYAKAMANRKKNTL